MWFKRRKKSEQDHALSESLRSLQTLLSESGRTEPNLEGGHAPPAAIQAGANGSDRRQSILASGKDPEYDDPGSSPVESDSGSCWKDLNLSFDAEPVAPKPRRETGLDEDDSSVAELENEAAAGEPHIDDPEPALEEPVLFYDELPKAKASGYDNDALEDDESLRATGDEPDLELDLTGAGTGDTGNLAEPPDPEADSLGESAVADVEKLGASGIENPETPGVDPGLEDSATGDVESLEEPVPVDAASPEVTGAASAGLDDLEAPARGDAQDPAGAETDSLPDMTGEASAPAGEPEDQLDLELDADEAAYADIPTLTEAVYVPDTAAEEPVSAEEPDAPAEEPLAVSGEPVPPAPEPEAPPPGPGASPHDESIERCLDNLRVRLQLMGVDALSAEQEKELHDMLVEFLDDFQHD